jgi:hypothetical protein
MGVTWEKIGQTSTLTNFPDVDSAVNYTSGWNVQGGPTEFLIVRGDITFDADPNPTSDMSNLVQGLRVVVNGEVLFDYRNPMTVSATSVEAGRLGYLLNSIGGRAYDVPGALTKEFYWAIPLGVQLPSSVNRWEIILDWGVANTLSDATSGELSYWIQYNDAVQKQTTIAPSTSFQSTANSVEQVVVRIPQNIPGVVSAILVQNDSQANEFGNQGIRVNALGSFGIEHTFWTFLNGDLSNGIMFSSGAAPQTFATEVKGCTLIPCFGLTGGNITMVVNSSEATTRTYTPIITAAIGKSQKVENVQTQLAPGNTAKSITARTLD